MTSNPLQQLPLPTGQRLVGRDDGASLALHLDERALLRARRQGELLMPLELAAEHQGEALWALAYWCFANDTQLQAVRLQLDSVEPALLASGLLVGEGSEHVSARPRRVRGSEPHQGRGKPR